MRTFREILLDMLEMPPECLDMTPKQIALQEDDHCWCRPNKHDYSIKSGVKSYARGKTQERAWMAAVIAILDLPLRRR